MLFFAYAVWILISCINELRILLAEETITWKDNAFTISRYVIFDQGLGTAIFYGLSLCGLGMLLTSQGDKEEKNEAE